MTREDALKVVSVASVADGYCGSCVSGCLAEAMAMWPDFDWRSLLPLAVDEWPGDELYRDLAARELVGLLEN